MIWLKSFHFFRLISSHEFVLIVWFYTIMGKVFIWSAITIKPLCYAYMHTKLVLFPRDWATAQKYHEDT